MVSGWNGGGSVLCGILLNGMAENSVFLRKWGGVKNRECLQEQLKFYIFVYKIFKFVRLYF